MPDRRKIAKEIERLLLPEGRLDPEAVEESQRRRLQLALALEAWRSGYEVVSVDQIADTAMLSKATLYALFVSKQGLLEAAVVDFTQSATLAIEAAQVQQASWSGAICAGMTALMDSVASDPALARLSFVEAPAVRIPSDDHAQVEITVLSRVLSGASGRIDEPPGEFEGFTRLATLNGMAAPIADRLIRGRSTEVPELARSLAYLVINARLGPELAHEALV